MIEKVREFFDFCSRLWDVIPGPVKVFIYATSSSAFGLWVAGELDWRAVAIIVATNLGIYTVPKGINKALNE